MCAVQCLVQPHQVEELVNVRSQGVCGNGFCEVGEEQNFQAADLQSFCSQDCLMLQACPSTDKNGNVVAVPSKRQEPQVSALFSVQNRLPSACSGRGSCVAATGACECHVGYTGTSCDECDFGFAKQNGTCAPWAVFERIASRPAVSQLGMQDEDSNMGGNPLVTTTKSNSSEPTKIIVVSCYLRQHTCLIVGLQAGMPLSVCPPACLPACCHAGVENGMDKK